MLYVGNRKSRQIHRPECKHGQQMARKNRIEFEKLEDALNMNYDGCCYCLKQFDRTSGYVRDKVNKVAGVKMADKIGEDPEALKNISVVYQEGEQSSAKPSISLRSLFTFPDQSMLDEDGKVEAKGNNLEYLKTAGSEKNVWSFAKDKAVLKVPVNCELVPQSFFSARLMLPKNTANGKKLLLTGPKQLPVKVYLNVSGGKYTVSLMLETEEGTVKCESAGEDSFATEKWYTITVVYTTENIFIIVDGKKCIVRKILFPHTVVEGKTDWFTIGYNAKEPKNQFRGYLSSFEYESEIKDIYWKLMMKAAKAGMGEIEYCYDSLDGAVSLGAKVSEGKYKDGGLYCEYKNGTIFWSPGTKACCVREPILYLYNRKYGGPDGALGYPVDNVGSGRRKEVLLQIFQKGAIYYDTGDQHGGGIAGKALEKYRAMGEDAAGIGVPSPFEWNKNDPKHPFDEKLERGFYKTDFVDMEGPAWHHSYIYFSDNTEPALLRHGYLNNFYWGDRLREYGYPLSDMTVLYTAGNGDQDCYMICENGEVYWSYYHAEDVAISPVLLNGDFLTEYHKRGGYNKLGMPKRWIRGTTEYLDCDNGVLVKYQGSFYFISEIRFEIIQAVAGKINDGINWNFSKDLTPELSYYLTLQAKNGRGVVDSELININSEYSRSKTSHKRTFPQSKFTMKIRGASTIYFFIKYVDWDAASDNDYLGSVSRTLSVDNLWGLIPGYTREGYNLQGVQELLLDHYGSDAKKLKNETVKTTFMVEQIDGKPYELNPDTFRSDSWWAFDNFKNSSVLGRDFVTNVFRDMEYVGSAWDKFCNPLDSLFYKAAKHAGDQGNCFGMCLGAVEAFYNRGRCRMPVKQYKANSSDQEYLTYSDEITDTGLRKYLQECQLRQFSLSSVKRMGSEFIGRKIQSPKKVFADVKAEIKKNNFSIITMLNIAKGFKGHTVLAYAVDDTTNKDNWKIFVADPNFSSRCEVNANGGVYRNTLNWIEVDPNKDTFSYVTPDSKLQAFEYDPVYRTTSSTSLANWKLGRFDGLMFSTPYRAVSGTPVTPSWYILGLAAAALVGLGILGPLKGAAAFLALIGLIGDADCAEIDCDGSAAKIENNEIIPLVPAGDGGNVQIYLVTKPASSYSVRYTGRSSGSVKQIIETPQRVYTVESALAKGETAKVSVSEGDNILPSLSLSGIKNKPVSMEIKNRHQGVYKENSEKLEMKTAASGEAALKLDMLTGTTKIQGAAKGNITLLKQVRSSGDTIEASRLTLESKDSSEEIRVARPKLFALKDVLVERVDPKTDKVKTREKYTFKKNN